MLHGHRSLLLFTFTVVLLPLLESFDFSFSRLLTRVHKTSANPGWKTSLISGYSCCLHHHGCGRGREGRSRQHLISLPLRDWNISPVGKAKWARTIQPREEKALTNVDNYLEWSCKEDEARLLSVTPSKSIWSNEHKPKQRFLVSIRKHFFTRVTMKVV